MYIHMYWNIQIQRRENRYNRILLFVFECNGAGFIKWDPPINVGVLDGGGQGPKQFRRDLNINYNFDWRISRYDFLGQRCWSVLDDPLTLMLRVRVV